jgi:hypothetical protein
LRPLVGLEVLDALEPEAVRLVGVANERPGALGDEHGVVVGVATGADRGEVGDVVSSAPAAGDQVMDLEVLICSTFAARCPLPAARCPLRW